MTATASLHRISPRRADQLDMPDQRLDRPFSDVQAPRGVQRHLNVSQLLLIAVPLVLSITLMISLLASDVSSLTYGILLLSVVVPYFWDAVAATLAIFGLFWKPSKLESQDQQILRIAILLTVFDEDADVIITRAVKLLRSLDAQQGHDFALHVISDSRTPSAAERESAVVASLMQKFPRLDINYRHRSHNTDFKSGNIRDWITTSGHAFDAMVILDADSDMTSAAVLEMVDALAADPACALVQTIPQVHAGRSRWQSLQSFASTHIGVNMGQGLGMVSDGVGNFYGHNALIRIRAFAASAGLPQLSGEQPFGGVIMSHDFVEAALLCRAGWHVRFMPDGSGSVEGTPETLVGYLVRDRRWCQGNLQHLRLLATPGLQAMSRFHLLQGAMSYLCAPFWLLAMLMWTTLPVQHSVSLLWPALIVVTTLLMPRLCGLLAGARAFSTTHWRFAVRELLLSVLVTPVLIVQRTTMIAAICLGHAVSWNARGSHAASLSFLLRFHKVEVAVGALLFVAVASGLMSWLVLLAALPLFFAPLLSFYLSQPARGHDQWTR